MAFLLAGTLAMSSFTVASADEPENEPLPVADEQKKEKYDNEVITEGQ